MSDAPLKHCRCGAQPRMAFDSEIVPPFESWSIRCADYCGDDTHWQRTLTKASELWNSEQVRHQRGGQG